MDIATISHHPSYRETNKEGCQDVANLLLSYLKQLSVDYVFGIPGGAIEPVYNALAESERNNGPRSIVARHESGAAFMADGYATHTGKLGVCCATTGPGATNLITGAASSFANQVPLLIITAQTALSTFGKGAFQESSCTGINTVAMFEYCTRYNTLVSHVEQFEQKLVAAVLSAFGSPSGPVHMSIPLDVLRADTGQTAPQYDLKKLLAKPNLVDERGVLKLFEALKNSHKIAFLIGEGAINGIDAILEVINKLDADILTTPHGKGLVSPYNPRFKGVIGFAGHQSAFDTLANPQLETVIAVGTTLGEWASNGWDADLLLNRRLIHVDNQDNNFVYTPMAKLHVKGEIKAIFEQLKLLMSIEEKQSTDAVFTSLARKMKHKEPISIPFLMDDLKEAKDDSAPCKPQFLMAKLPEVMPPSTRYLADTGASFAWAIHYLHPYDRRLMGPRNARGGLFRACLEFSSMGWAIGCAVGASLALKKQPVVCITGDGSLLMSGQEITVAVQEQLPILFIVLNDSSLGMVKHGQRLAKAEAIGIDIPFTDFAKLADSMGAVGHVISAGYEFDQLDFNAMINDNKPHLIDVRIDTEQVPPIGMRIKTLREN